MARTEQFLTLFNELERYLRERTDSRKEVPFGSLIHLASESQSVVRHHAHELREWADLRNAIVHEHPRGQIIAEVTPAALERFQKLTQRITSPPMLIPLYQRSIRVFAGDDRLTDAVQDLWSNQYSQVIVRPRDQLMILSFAGITRWMASRIEGTTIDLAGATVDHALAFEEPGGVTFLARDQTVYDAREAFLRFPQKHHQRLRAALVTHNGKATEEPLGIVTSSDLVELQW
jgi:hypothetical protein